MSEQALEVEEEARAAEEPAKRRPWWWRVGALVIEVVVIVGIAAAVPRVLSWVLDTPHPLAAITSSSMWPTLKRGDLVLVKGLSDAAVQPGMIVVYRSTDDGTMVIHRVIEVEGEEIVTQGDANVEPDAPIARADVAGVVQMLGGRPVRVPHVGRITLLVRAAP